jgi:hypothetical protein
MANLSEWMPWGIAAVIGIGSLCLMLWKTR